MSLDIPLLIHFYENVVFVAGRSVIQFYTIHKFIHRWFGFSAFFKSSRAPLTKGPVRFWRSVTAPALVVNPSLASLMRLPTVLGMRGVCTVVPIRHVARIVRLHVAGESEAAQADIVVAKMRAELDRAALPGYLKIIRTVCKSEWAYETAIVYDSLENFKVRRASPTLRNSRATPATSHAAPNCASQRYMESDFRHGTLTPLLGELTQYSLHADTVYTGNRVYDEFPHLPSP